MFQFLKHLEFVRRGFCPQQPRRVYEEGKFSAFFERSPLVTALIAITSFALILAIMGFYYEFVVVRDKFFLTALIFLASMAYLKIVHPEIVRDNSKLLLVSTAVILNLAITKGMFVGFKYYDSDIFSFYYVPTAFAPLLISTLLGPSVAMFVVIFLSLLIGCMVPDKEFQMLGISLLTGIMAVYFTQDVRKRSHFIRAGIYVGLTSMVCALAFGLTSDMDVTALMSGNFLSNQGIRMLLIQSLGGAVVGVFWALMVNGVLPVFENVFKITTKISWLEMTDVSHPLLKEMAIRAPGTYHHSLSVANLSESAAEAVGANPLVCRVGSYFHDVGKLVKPDYFIENMNLEMGNPHDKLTPNMSALIIASHVKEGVDMALKHGLNREIIDIIREHHGTSLIYFFYRRAKLHEQDTAAGCKIMDMNLSDIPRVDESTFRYPGPKPQTRESGIVSICDTIEAASRSLHKPTPQSIEQLVREVIDTKLLDGQLDECHLSVYDLRVIHEKLVFLLTNMMHSRISYPKNDQNPTTAKGKITAFRAG
ncbi:MAG: HDIG domain-containing protein [Verrucomicrobiae bacterium]|nr:HDIG domain-containing protein [Verrucomicrobiae bacterium]